MLPSSSTSVTVTVTLWYAFFLMSTVLSLSSTAAPRASSEATATILYTFLAASVPSVVDDVGVSKSGGNLKLSTPSLLMVKPPASATSGASRGVPPTSGRAVRSGFSSDQ